MRLNGFCLGLLAAMLLPALAHGAEPFVVRNFRVEGAQRISEGTIYNYLPINIGDLVDDQRIREAIRAVYGTGFFRNVEFRRDGDTLVIAVLERPSIEDFSFTGNKDIDTEDLENSMREVGLARGRVFDRSVLEEVKRALTDQYYSRGKYGVRINTPVEELPDNKVRVSIEIEEGDRARIREINIVGNTSFPDDEIRDGFESSTGGLFSFISQNDRYAKQTLEGDLERLRSFYMDRGFADFRVDGVQVSISPDKRDIFISVSITEGDRYTISDVKLAGNMVVPAAELRNLIQVQPGQVFSQQALASSESFMTARLGRDGYAFAQVRAVPDLDREAKEADITFFVDPQNRVYVRRINFNGADNVNDEVFRREMRQLEGGYLSNSLLDLSQARLQRLPYVESVEHETRPVPGSPDLVDIEFQIEEGLPGQFGGGIGFSETQGVLLNGNFVHSNFMGTGNRIQAQLQGGEFIKLYDLNYTDQYRTIDGLSRNIQFSYSDITQFTTASSDFSTQRINTGVTWAYPVTEYQILRFGLAFQLAELITSEFSSLQARQWVADNGSPFVAASTDTGDLLGTQVQSFEFVTGWIFDTRNRALFPDRGTRVGLSLSAAIPGSEVEYYVANLDFTKYMRLPGRWRFKINSNISFGDSYGETTALPPFRNFFGGGPSTVRAFKQSWLGPRDSLQRPYGGNLLFANQFELIVPTPEQLGGSTRLSVFYDIGNVFSTGGVEFFDRLGDPITYDFDYNMLKQSAGIAVEWLAPLGLLRFSYGIPLNDDADTDRYWGDQVEQFQFNIGNAF
jgi:outer membrane protein insertion porin family